MAIAPKPASSSPPWTAWGPAPAPELEELEAAELVPVAVSEASLLLVMAAVEVVLTLELLYVVALTWAMPVPVA